MASSNLFPIRPIGPLLAISFCLGLGAEGPATWGATPAIRVQAEKSKNNPAFPMLGLFSIGQKGVTRIISHRPDLAANPSLTILTHKGCKGTLRGITLLPLSNCDPQADLVFPGKVTGYLRDDLYTHYAAYPDLRPDGSNLFPLEPTLGVVLPEGVMITPSARKHEYRVQVNKAVYTVTFSFSSGGLHVKCLEHSSRKVLEHLYFSLPYDVEPNADSHQEPMQEGKAGEAEVLSRPGFAPDNPPPKVIPTDQRMPVPVH